MPLDVKLWHSLDSRLCDACWMFKQVLLMFCWCFIDDILYSNLWCLLTIQVKLRIFSSGSCWSINTFVMVRVGSSWLTRVEEPTIVLPALRPVKWLLAPRPWRSFVRAGYTAWEQDPKSIFIQSSVSPICVKDVNEGRRLFHCRPRAAGKERGMQRGSHAVLGVRWLSWLQWRVGPKVHKSLYALHRS